MNTTSIGEEAITYRANKGYLCESKHSKSGLKDIFEYQTPGYSDLEITDDSRVGKASVYEAKFWVKKMGSLMSEKKSLLEESKENHR